MAVAGSTFLGGRTRSLLVAMATLTIVACVAGEAGAQSCTYGGSVGFPGWAYVSAGGGVGVPLAPGMDSVLALNGPVLDVGVGLQFFNGLRLELDYSYAKYSGLQSFYDYVLSHRVQASFGVRPVTTKFFDWYIFIEAGMDFAEKVYLRPTVDAQGRLIPVVDPITGQQTGVEGVKLMTQAPAFVPGLSMRFIVFPLEPWGIFLDAGGAYSMALGESWTMEEGSCQLRFMAGSEVHF